METEGMRGFVLEVKELDGLHGATGSLVANSPRLCAASPRDRHTWGLRTSLWRDFGKGGFLFVGS